MSQYLTLTRRLYGEEYQILVFFKDPNLGSIRLSAGQSPEGLKAEGHMTLVLFMCPNIVRYLQMCFP